MAQSSRAGSATDVLPMSSSDHTTTDPTAKDTKGTPPDTDGRSAPPGDTPEGMYDRDTEMVDARSSPEEQQEANTFDQSVFTRIPNLFRLLDLVDEQGTGGIVEKMVIDQTSLHHLINTVQPGSYDSVSKINFKSLDKLSIKATGLYGIRSEIITYLKQVQYISDDAGHSMRASTCARHGLTFAESRTTFETLARVVHSIALDNAIRLGMSRTRSMHVTTLGVVPSTVGSADDSAAIPIIFTDSMPPLFTSAFRSITVLACARLTASARHYHCHPVTSLIFVGPLGHHQLHETSHGSMTATKWVLEGSDANPVYELEGRKFGSGDEGAPMMCSLVCKAQGRHAHIDYCRNPDNCDELECEHINELMHPEPDRPKDWTSHALSWARSYPYSQGEQTEFSKCDVLCAGPEHEATSTATAKPSYCTLPIFHAPQPQRPAPTTGHVSLDGHLFD
ncbi:hypothetical protein FRC07_006288, partial [Ceratobasidium sp. 392]